MEKVLIIDIDNYLHRLYSINTYKLQNSEIEDSEKLKIILKNSSSILGVINNLKENKFYNRVIGCYDTKDSKNSNSNIYKKIIEKYNIDTKIEYKEGRQKDPVFFEYKKHMLNFFYLNGIKLAASDHHEADDVIATFAKNNGKRGNYVHVLTIDRDLYQIVDENIKIIEGLSNDTSKIIEIGRQEVMEYFLNNKKSEVAIYPEDIPYFKAIVGDSSDKILGIKGVGKKTFKKDFEENNNNIKETKIFKDNYDFINDLLQVTILNESIGLEELKILETIYDEEKINGYREKIGLSRVNFEEIKESKKQLKMNKIK